jgi:hypothetical protein
MQWDYRDGPVVDGRATELFCAWLAWARFRVVLALRDKTLPSVVIGLDRAMRRFDGVPDVSWLPPVMAWFPPTGKRTTVRTPGRPR